MRSAAIASLLAALVGCGTEGPDSKPPAPAQPTATTGAPEKTPAKTPGEGSATASEDSSDNAGKTVPEHMSAHFARALRIKDAVITGQLDKVREPAKWLAEHGAPKGIPDEWIPFVTELRQISAGVDEAKTLADVADFLSRAGVVCARCHRENKAKIEIAESPQPDADDAPMQIHAWATDRLWEGLTLPSSSHWQRGSDALVGSPLLQGDEKAFTALKDAAAKAPKAEADLDRGAVFAQLIATCAACHQARPKKEPPK